MRSSDYNQKQIRKGELKSKKRGIKKQKKGNLILRFNLNQRPHKAHETEKPNNQSVQRQIK